MGASHRRQWSARPTIDGVRFDDAWGGRAEIDIEGLCVPVIGRRELVLNKRTVGRPQDLVDAVLLESLD